ncbi:MAG: succinylglutamate desuccinylase/aspartoacylase family protein [Myxococcales bacterium]|nr:succinylglutamate desuccinylase/aspartoacylase family protein [Myxococcales bacterium]
MKSVDDPTNPLVEALDLEGIPAGSVVRLRLRMIDDGRGEPICVPVLIAKGGQPGLKLGLTAAVHGDELNGMRVIHKVFDELAPSALRGTIIAVPVVNVPAFVNESRRFPSGEDLNRIMPGKPDGTTAQIYAHRLTVRILEQLDYLIDLHTASFGRVNTLYVRADLRHPETAWMARAQHPQIILHNPGDDGTLRAAAMARKIPAIAVEVGDPMRFQGKLIREGFVGLANVLAHLGMIDLEEAQPSLEPIVCARSYWIHSDIGGLLQVFPALGARVREGERIARVTDVYGTERVVYYAPEDGVVIGKSTNPVNPTGSRILHLGVVDEAQLAADGSELNGSEPNGSAPNGPAPLASGARAEEPPVEELSADEARAPTTRRRAQRGTISSP